MTGGITSFGIALFWQKAIEFFTKSIIYFLTYREECLFNSEYRIVLLTCFADLFQIGQNMDCWVTVRCASQMTGGQGLLTVV